MHVSNYYYIEEQARLAENICKNSVADKIFLANSGAEANEGAIKLARIYQYKKGYSEKYEIITLVNSFHGRTLTTVSATGQEKFQTPFKPLTPGFVHVPINDFDALLSAVTPKFIRNLASVDGSLKSILKNTRLLNKAIQVASKWFTMLTRMLMRKIVQAFISGLKQAFEDMVLFEKNANDAMLQLNYNVSIVFCVVGCICWSYYIGNLYFC